MLSDMLAFVFIVLALFFGAVSAILLPSTTSIPLAGISFASLAALMATALFMNR